MKIGRGNVEPGAQRSAKISLEERLKDSAKYLEGGQLYGHTMIINLMDL